MEITKLSASAMEVAELCLSRWDADNKAGRIGFKSGIPAMVGSACHGAGQDLSSKRLSCPTRWIACSRTSRFSTCSPTWKSSATSTSTRPPTRTGWGFMKKWFACTSWDGFKVLMVEEKLNFPVPTGRLNPDGTKETIPFNFIFDRFDQMDEEGVFRVVDYKTLSQPLSPMDLHDKIQPRAYGLAAQILHPEATKIWVGFDMWRWESPIETFYTREDNIVTWNRIKGCGPQDRRARPRPDRPSDWRAPGYPRDAQLELRLVHPQEYLQRCGGERQGRWGVPLPGPTVSDRCARPAEDAGQGCYRCRSRSLTS